MVSCYDTTKVGITFTEAKHLAAFTFTVKYNIRQLTELKETLYLDRFPKYNKIQWA